MRQSVWILNDQLTHMHPGIEGADVVLLIESRKMPFRHHRMSLVMAVSAMRHFARELRETGRTVDHHALEEAPDFATAFRVHLRRHKPERVVVMEPNSLFERRGVERVCREARVECVFVESVQFLVSRESFRKWAAGKKRLLMETFYRWQRVERGILVDEKGAPEGGQWNFDEKNRGGIREWKAARGPHAKPPQTGDMDAITREAAADVARFFPDAPGRSEPFWPPVTRAQALDRLETFIRERLPRYGEFQDLMLTDDPWMFHSLLSAPINLGLLNPAECVEAVLAAYREGLAPLASVEGFVRQIIGWREFINGVYWLRGPDYLKSNALRAGRSLPDLFRSGGTDLNCLRQCVRQVLDSGYNHHIQRLMVLGNFLLLAGVRPGEALRWFNEMYVDAYDWVMAANVLGMTLHADGGFMATKPYAASGKYISRMSNYCGSCRFDPNRTTGPDACPFNALYWAFYDRHAARFRANPRTSVMIRSWEKRAPKDRAAILRQAEEFLEGL